MLPVLRAEGGGEGIATFECDRRAPPCAVHPSPLPSPRSRVPNRDLSRLGTLTGEREFHRSTLRACVSESSRSSSTGFLGFEARTITRPSCADGRSYSPRRPC